MCGTLTYMEYNNNTCPKLCPQLIVCAPYTCRMVLGMFDPSEMQPYLNISTDQISSAAHQVSEPLNYTP